MKKINLLYLLSFVVLGLGLSGCYSSDFDYKDYPNTAFEKKGAVIEVGNVASGFFNLTNLENAFVEFDIDAKGAAATGAKIFKSFNGGTPVEHSSVSSLPATIKVTLAEALNGLNVAKEDLKVGDVIKFSFEASSAGGSYKTGKTFDAVMSCPSDLAGTYAGTTSGTSTDDCCPGVVSAEKMVTITDLGDGNYSMGDFTSGLYFTWYEAYGITADHDLTGTFSDVCGTLSGTFAEPFGKNVELTGSVDAETGVITYTWTSGWGDTAEVVLTPQ